jgi:hypothetical protein
LGFRGFVPNSEISEDGMDLFGGFPDFAEAPLP